MRLKKSGIARAAVITVCTALLLGVGGWKAGWLRPQAETATPEVTARTVTSKEKIIPPIPAENRNADCLYPIVAGYDSGICVCYAAPEPGRYFCFEEVKEARRINAGRHALYLLAMDLFAADNRVVTEEEEQAEYRRLAAKGYVFYPLTCWEYAGEEMTRVEHQVVMGVFTEDQLDAFDANPQYGYAFRFVRNGDGSEVAFDSCCNPRLFPELQPTPET